jgi:hypothetical protein
MILFLANLLALFLSFFRVDRNWVEWIALAAAALLAGARPQWVSRLFAGPASRLDSLARRPYLASAVIGTLCIAGRLLLLPIEPVPAPVITDEFSHLLLGNTLAQGHLTNPAHPMWRHFESIHILQQPTYNSMYFPGQGAFLAAGRLLFGIPWAGVLASTALVCIAIYWALQAWLPPRWALLAGLLAVLKIALFSYWVNSYWGGAVPAAGGALVLGAWGRIRRKPSSGSAALMGLGLVLLAASRPFEGLALSLIVAIAMIARRRLTLQVVLPIALILFCGITFMLREQKAVTGRWFLPAYTINQQMYGWPMTLPWFPVPQIGHTHPPMQAYFDWEASEHHKLTDPLRNWFKNGFDATVLWSFYTGPALTVLLLFLPSTLLDRRVRFLALAVGALLLSIGIEQSRYPHYFAPATAAWFGVLMHSARHLRARARRSPRLLALATLIPVALVVSAAVRTTTGRSDFDTYLSWCCSKPGNFERAGVLARLSATPDQHLVIVRYGPEHNFTKEWVYNEPDIDKAKVVWARDMQPAENEELLRYFHDRKTWIVYADAVPARLVPISPPDFNLGSAFPRDLRFPISPPVSTAPRLTDAPLATTEHDDQRRASRRVSSHR